MKKFYLALIFIFFASTIAIQAQSDNDTVNQHKKKEKPAKLEPYHWNVIKFNPTPMLVWGDRRNVTFAYERLINKDMSVSLQLGYLLFPNLLDDTVLNIINIYDRSRTGTNVALDYRYYPFERNRRPAPDGLYVGGYLSYYGFQFENKFNILNTGVVERGELKGKVNIANIGIELGYQFIFWKRFSVDLILFGPSYTVLKSKLNISGQLNEDEIQNIDQDLVEKLMDRFPYLQSVFSAEGLEFTGTKTRFATLLRYSVTFGFHF